MSHGFKEEQLSKFKEASAKYRREPRDDGTADEDGVIPANSLAQLLKELGLSPSSREFRDWTENLQDENPEGIDFPNFVLAVQKAMDSNRNQLRKAFHNFDRNQDGTINSRDLTTALRSLGQNPSEEEAKKWLDEVRTTL